MSALSSTLPTPLASSPPSPGPLDPRSLTSPSQITHQLSLLTKREADLSLELNALVSDRRNIDTALARLRHLGSQVASLASEVDGTGGGPSRSRGLNGGSAGYFDDEEGEDEGLVERVRRVWETSERVGGKVRRLDEEIGRVREATDIVTEVLELKVSPSVHIRTWEYC